MPKPELNEFDARITKIEEYLWGGGPSGPTIFNERIERVEEAIQFLEARFVTHSSLDDAKRDLDDLKRIIAELRQAIVRGDPGGGVTAMGAVSVICFDDLPLPATRGVAHPLLAHADNIRGNHRCRMLIEVGLPNCSFPAYEVSTLCENIVSCLWRPQRCWQLCS